MGIPKSVEQAREYSNNINNVDATLMPQNEQNLAIRYALHDIAKKTGEAPAFNFDYSPVDYDDTLSSEIYKPYVNPLQDAFGMLWNAVPSIGAALVASPTILASGAISLMNDALERITGDDYDDPKVQKEKYKWYYDPSARGSIEWTNAVNDFFDSWKYKPSDRAQEKLDVTNFWATANPNNVAANIGNGIGSVIAFIGTIALTKGMSGGGSVKLFQGLSNISKAEVLGSYIYMNNEIYNEFRSNAKIDDLTAAKLSSLVSLPIALSEYVGLSALGKVMTKPMVKNAIKGGVEEAIASYGTKGLTKELYQDFTAKAIQGIGNRMTTAALKGAEGAVIEGVQEYGQGKMQQAAEALYDKIANEKVFGTELFNKQALKDDVNNAFWGGAIGGLLGMGGGMINSKEMQESVFHYVGINLQKNRPAKIDGVKKFITQLGENGKITPEQTEQGLKMVDEMVAIHKDAMPLMLKDIDARYQAYEFIQARNKIQEDLAALDEKPVDPTLAKADSELRTIMEQSAAAYDEAIALIAKTKGQISESELGKKLSEIGTQFNKVETPVEEVKTEITPIENKEELSAAETKVNVQKSDIEKTLYGTISGSIPLSKALPNGVYIELGDGLFAYADKNEKIAAIVDKNNGHIVSKSFLNSKDNKWQLPNKANLKDDAIKFGIDESIYIKKYEDAVDLLNYKYINELEKNKESKQEEVKVDLVKNEEMLKKAEKALKSTITKIEQLKTQPLGAKESQEARDEKIANFEERKKQIETKIGELNDIREAETRVEGIEETGAVVETADTGVSAEEVVNDFEDKKADIERRIQEVENFVNQDFFANSELLSNHWKTKKDLFENKIKQLKSLLQKGIKTGEDLRTLTNLLNDVRGILNEGININDKTAILTNEKNIQELANSLFSLISDDVIKDYIQVMNKAMESRIGSNAVEKMLVGYSDGSGYTIDGKNVEYFLSKETLENAKNNKQINAKYDAESAELEKNKAPKQEEAKVDLGKNEEMLKKAEKALKSTITKIEQLKTQPLGAKESQDARDEKIANFEERKKQIETKIGELNDIREAETRVSGVEETGAVVETADTGVSAEEVRVNPDEVVSEVRVEPDVNTQSGIEEVQNEEVIPEQVQEGQDVQEDVQVEGVNEGVNEGVKPTKKAPKEKKVESDEEKNIKKDIASLENKLRNSKGKKEARGIKKQIIERKKMLNAAQKGEAYVAEQKVNKEYKRGVPKAVKDFVAADTYGMALQYFGAGGRVSRESFEQATGLFKTEAKKKGAGRKIVKGNEEYDASRSMFSEKAPDYTDIANELTDYQGGEIYDEMVLAMEEVMRMRKADINAEIRRNVEKMQYGGLTKEQADKIKQEEIENAKVEQALINEYEDILAMEQEYLQSQQIGFNEQDLNEKVAEAKDEVRLAQQAYDDRKAQLGRELANEQPALFEESKESGGVSGSALKDVESTAKALIAAQPTDRNAIYYHASEGNDIIFPSTEGYKKREGNNVVIEGVYFGKDEQHLLDRYGVNSIKVILVLNNPLITDNIYTYIDGKVIDYRSLSKEDIEYLKTKGYDSVQYKSADKSYKSWDETVVFDKKQVYKIKEASRAYHKAKADGSNPELVKAVEDLLGKAPTQYTEAAIMDRGDVNLSQENIDKILMPFKARIETAKRNLEKIDNEAQRNQAKDLDKRQTIIKFEQDIKNAAMEEGDIIDNMDENGDIKEDCK